MKKAPIFAIIVVISLVTLACGISLPKGLRLPTSAPQASQSEPITDTITAASPVAKITGSFSYSNDFVVETYFVEQAVSLADMHGFVLRDKEWETPAASQVLGLMNVDYDNNKGDFSLALPLLPEGEFNDVNPDGKTEKGVQIFAVAYWPNLAGGPFSEGDDPSFGWPNYLASIKTDSENQDEVTGGKLLVWSPDAEQKFPSRFGEDGLLFTEDDPIQDLPAGYSVIDLDTEPFTVIRERQPAMTLYEPTDLAVKDYSADSFSEAFEKMFNALRKEYAFNDIPGKAPEWDAVYAELAPRIKEAEANNDQVAYFLAIRDFSYAFKDGHVGLSGGGIEDQVFSEAVSSGYGMAIRILDDQSVIVNYLTPRGPADLAGIKLGAKILQFNGKPILQAIAEVKPLSAPFSTDFSEIYQQARYLMRAPIGTETQVVFVNPGENQITKTIKAAEEYESYSYTSVYRGSDPNALPVEFRILDEGLGYIKINSNYDDLNLTIRLFERALKTFTINQLPGVVIDLRQNAGGSPLGLAGFLTDREIEMGQLEYYSEKTGKFEAEGPRDSVLPMVEQYSFEKMALLVGQACASACEIEAYGFSQVPGMLVFGETPSAGVEAEVARGQFVLPAGISFQAPTGRFTMPDGSIFLEGKGVQPTNLVPITAENVLFEGDYTLQFAIDTLLKPEGAGVVPSGSPRLGTTEEALAALEDGTTQALDSLADEQYDTLSTADETYNYHISLSESQPLFWMYAWCAVDKATLEKNFKSMKVNFLLEGVPADPAVLSTSDFSDANSSCRYQYYLLTDWPGGEHHLTTQVTLTDNINDGTMEFPKGEFAYDYTVYVKP